MSAGVEGRWWPHAGCILHLVGLASLRQVAEVALAHCDVLLISEIYLLQDYNRFKAHRGSRDTHETDTRTSQTNLKTNPTHRLTRQTTPEPRDAHVPVPLRD